MDATALETIRCDPQAEARFFKRSFVAHISFANKLNLGLIPFWFLALFNRRFCSK